MPMPPRPTNSDFQAAMLEHMVKLHDKVESSSEAIHAEIAGLRTEIRDVAGLQREHSNVDLEKFSHVYDGQRRLENELHHLRDRVMGVEDTSRNFTMSSAVAAARLEERLPHVEREVAGARSRRFDWTKVGVGALLTFLIGLALAGITAVAKGAL